jgi:hypothetical protein
MIIEIFSRRFELDGGCENLPKTNQIWTVNSLTAMGVHGRPHFNELCSTYCSFLPNFYPFAEFDSALNAQ